MSEHRAQISEDNGIIRKKLNAVYSHYDSALKMALYSLGAKISGEVSKKTDIVISDDMSSNKNMTKAQDLGIQVFNKEELDNIAVKNIGRSTQNAFIAKCCNFVEECKNDRRYKETWEYESDTDLLNYWEHFAIARYIGIPEDILSFYNMTNGWSFNWRIPDRTRKGNFLFLGGSLQFSQLSELLNPYPTQSCPNNKGIGAIEKHLDTLKSCECLIIGHFEGPTELVIKNGEFEGMYASYGLNNFYKLPFYKLEDYIEAVIEARGISNWQFALLEDDDPIRQEKMEKVYKKAQKLFEFDADEFRDKWGVAKNVGFIRTLL